MCQVSGNKDITLRRAQELFLWFSPDLHYLDCCLDQEG